MAASACGVASSGPTCVVSPPRSRLGSLFEHPFQPGRSARDAVEEGISGGAVVLRWLATARVDRPRRRAPSSARGPSKPTTARSTLSLRRPPRFSCPRRHPPGRSTRPARPRRASPSSPSSLRGETVADVFGKLGLAGGELREATNALAGKVDLRALKAGNRYSAFFNPDASLASFEMTLDGSGRVEMIRRGERLAQRLGALPAPRRGPFPPGHARRLAGGVDPQGRRPAVPRLPACRRLPVGPRLHQGPQAGGPLRGPLPGGPARRPVPRHRHGPGGDLRQPRAAPRGLPLRRRQRLLRRRRPADAEDVPPLAAALLARHLGLQPPPLPSGAQRVPAALRRRLQRAGGHARAGDGERHGALRRLGPGAAATSSRSSTAAATSPPTSTSPASRRASGRARGCGRGTSSPSPAPPASPPAPTWTTG